MSSPRTIVEPTCGEGSILAAAVRRFPSADRAIGFDISARHAATARGRISDLQTGVDCLIHTDDFFQIDWHSILSSCAEPILIVGNPPWVTNATLGRLASGNHPRKENRQRLSGIEALTGKSNFDVSEWMISRLLEAASGRRATLAMLCKTAVAHKVLANAWKSGLPLEQSEIRPIDASRHFGAQVDACLLVCHLGSRAREQECLVFDDFSSEPSRSSLRSLRRTPGRRTPSSQPHSTPGWRRISLAVRRQTRLCRHLRAAAGGDDRATGLGEKADLERHHVYPLLKSSHLARGETGSLNRQMLLPQQYVGQETASLAERAPKTWRYLLRHADRLDRRASSVYRNQPRFSIFGVGPYTFCKWKVMVSGFYKSWRFVAVGPVENRPVLCDDTCYFLPCRSAAEARQRADHLNSERGREFLSAFVFNQAKRPLTAEILGLLDLEALAAERNLATKRRTNAARSR